MIASVSRLALVLLGAGTPAVAQVQEELDRADPVLVEEARPAPRDLDPLAPAPSVATPSTETGIGTTSVQVGAIRLDGLEALPAARFAGTLAPYLGRSLGPDEQRMLLAAVLRTAQQAGYPLATAVIPPQAVVGGVLHIRLDEGRIAGVRFAGDRHPLAQRILSALADNRPISAARLERALRLAGALPGMWVRDARLAGENGINVLVVDLRDDRADGYAGMDNWGTEAIGPVQARVRIERRSLLRLGDELTLSGGATPLDPGEYHSLGLRYATPLGADGAQVELAASVAGTHAGGRLRSRNYLGTGERFSAALSYPLLLRRGETLRGSVGIALRDTDTRLDGRPSRSDRVSLLFGEVEGFLNKQAGFLSGGLTLYHGPGWLNATRRGDPLASRVDGDARFTKLEARALWQLRLHGPLSLQLDAEAQIASRPLLAGDEFGIGGARFGRGYEYRERAGDQGIAGSAELRYDLRGPRGARALQFYGYADASHARDRRNGRRDSLHSAGAGVRATLSRRSGFGLELGVPLDGSNAPRLSLNSWSRF